MSFSLEPFTLQIKYTISFDHIQSTTFPSTPQLWVPLLTPGGHFIFTLLPPTSHFPAHLPEAFGTTKQRMPAPELRLSPLKNLSIPEPCRSRILWSLFPRRIAEPRSWLLLVVQSQRFTLSPPRILNSTPSSHSLTFRTYTSYIPSTLSPPESQLDPPRSIHFESLFFVLLSHLDAIFKATTNRPDTDSMHFPQHCPIPDCLTVLTSLQHAEDHSLLHPDDRHCMQCPLMFADQEDRRKHVKEVHQSAVQLAFNGAKYKLYRQQSGTFACPVSPCADGTADHPFASPVPGTLQAHWNRRHKDLQAGFLASPDIILDFTLFLQDGTPATVTPAVVIDVDDEDPAPVIPSDTPVDSFHAEALALGALVDVSPPPLAQPIPTSHSDEHVDLSDVPDLIDLDDLSDVPDLIDLDYETDEDEDDADPAPLPQPPSESTDDQAQRIAQLREPKLETSVDPSPDSTPIRSDHDLFGMGYLIHAGFHVAICTNCHEAVSPKSLITHARAHGVPPLPQARVDEVCVEFVLVSPPQAPRLPIGPPIPHLRPPILGLFGCPSCSYAAKNVSTVREHQKGHHPSEPRSHPLDGIHTQQLNSATQTAHFQVDISLPPLINTTSAQSAITKIVSEQIARDTQYQRLPPTTKHVDIWPRKSKWHHALRNADRKTVHQLGAFPSKQIREDSWLLRLTKPALRYFTEAITATAGLTADTRAQLKNPYPKEFNHSPSSYAEPQESVTFQTYARYGVQILACILRSIHQPVPGFDITFTPEQSPHIQALYRALRDNAQPDIIQSLIHPLFFSLVQSFSGRVADDDFRCPLVCANIATNVNAEGQLRDIRAIAPTFTRLQWCIRAVVASHISQRPDSLSEDAACLEIAHLIIEHEPTPFGRNRRYIHIIKYIIEGSPSKPTVVYSEDGRSLSCLGDVLSLQVLRDGVHRLLDEVESDFANLVLRGLQYPELEHLLSRFYDPLDDSVRVHDNHRSTTPGYSFVWDPRNPFQPFRFRFLADLIDSNVQCEGNNFWVDGKLNSAAISHWNRQTTLWWEKTIILSHICSGGSSRATEFSLITHAQLHDGDRKVHTMPQGVVLLFTYSKSSENTARDKMVFKPLPKRLSNVLTTFLVLVRPAELALAPYAGMTQRQQENYATHLFVAEGELITDQRIRFLMRRISDSYFGIGLSYNQIRHIFKAITLRETGHDLDNIDTHEERPADAVFHHKRGTADRHYAVHPEQHESSRQPAFQAYLKIGYLIHEFLGLRQPPIPLLDTSVTPSNLPMVTATLTSLIDSLDARITDQVASLKHSLFLGLSQVLNGLPTTSSPPVEAAIRRPLDLDIHASRLTVLTRYYLDINRHPPTMLELSQPSFRSLEQAQYVDHILYCRGHAVVVLPTGGGKTVGIAAAAYLYEKVAGLIVVFLPFIALMESAYHDLCRIAPTARFGRDDWSPFTTKILLISLEHLTDPRHLRSFMGLHGHIKYIFLDEIHELLINNSFRPLFNDLKQLISLGCPIIMMSATIPPTSVDTLLQRLNIAYAQIIRKPITARPEIRYAAHKITPQELPSRISDFLETHPCGSNDRGIVFCTTKKSLAELAVAHSGVKYHSDLSRDERELATARWEEGREAADRVMFATKGFGTGVHMPGVRFAVFAGEPDGILQFDQPAGRAGRDGKPCDVVIFWFNLPRRFPSSDSDALHHGGFDALCRMLSHPTRCLRWERSEHIDGKGLTCASLSGVYLQLCQRCEIESQSNIDFLALADALQPPPAPTYAADPFESADHLPIPPPQFQPSQSSTVSSTSTSTLTTDNFFSHGTRHSSNTNASSSQATTLVAPRTPTKSQQSDSVFGVISPSRSVPGQPGSPSFSQALKRTVHDAHHTPRKFEKRLKPSNPSPPRPSSVTARSSTPSLPFPGSTVLSTMNHSLPFLPPLPTPSLLGSTHPTVPLIPLFPNSTEIPPPTIPLALQLPTIHHSDDVLPPTAQPLSLRDKLTIARKADFDAAVLRIVSRTSEAAEQFRVSADWGEGCPLELVLRKHNILHLHPDANPNGCAPHSGLYWCKNSLMQTTWNTQWKSWRERLPYRCQIREQYHTRCWAPMWAPNHWYHYKNAKGHCSDFLKDFWVALWYSPIRSSLIAHVSLDPSVSITNVFDYQEWLVKRWNSDTLLINGIVMVHEWLQMYQLLVSVA
ncbi:hypothetical protein SISNIDRAFT_491815 [Sistotremastrum niveocremeum HHB9708]|uniref:DNA 3'-5' helicase n=1 Tax=Sistotremastrum niveocremeum HHB9708 TaxID=1314777 RepID=A0A164MD21_9AGAM|nr:hypothetical protein SISNIDRAFT_491815 [Sistotremastrum niveocremeum HHB9708]